ncbi:bpX6 domain-containing protein [Bartonella sp. HY329]|uniref:bpX6 domain-containing protein n=1 Tax=unclassified Bartonella TaxID=2645622 RepID=UPI0021C9493E|nr:MULTISPECIES: bpX6 domain-containing protein [unclassified Bartonella]UXM95095.1 bpX6 domain-containing protein [Bartonella sp. HY329]UXN09418.1 bpX6 domain-containing protein [Bartonella sp. HY328]
MDKTNFSPVRQPLAQGRRDVAGLWLPHEWYSESERQRIIWHYWQKGAQILRFSSSSESYFNANGDLLRFPVACSMLCSDLPGLPLIAYGAMLTTADLDKNEQKTLPVCDCWIIAGNETKALKFSQGAYIDPSNWANIANYTWHESFDLAPPVIEIEEIAPKPSGDTRTILGDNIPQPSESQEKILKDLKKKAVAKKTRKVFNRPWIYERERTTADGMGSKIIAIYLIVLALFFYIFFVNDIPHSTQTTATPQNNPVAQPIIEYSSSPSIFYWLVVFGLVALFIFLLRQFLISNIFNKITASSVEQYTKYQDSLATQQSYRQTTRAQGPSVQSTHQDVEQDGVNDAIKANNKPQTQNSSTPKAEGNKNKNHSKNNKNGLKQRDEDKIMRPPLWRLLVARLAIVSNLNRLFAMRQARYLNSMLRMFEQGDIENALRHAIPFSSSQSDGGPMFGVPRPRDNLQLGAKQVGGPSINIDEDARKMLTSYYRRAFTTLDKQGRIEEAAFVLAELLDERLEALDYLEKNDRSDKAAELALAWDMSSDIIVRLYCLAGKWDWAIAVARRDHAFAAAVLRLERDKSSASVRLRKEWAFFEAENGNLMSAIQIIWPLKNQRDLALQWLLLAEKSDGELAAAALVKRAILLSDTVEDYRTKITQIIEDKNPKVFAALISEIDKAFLNGDSSEGLIFLTRFITRPALLRHQQNAFYLEKQKFLRLLHASKQFAFGADLPQTGWGQNSLEAFSADNICQFKAPTNGRPLDIHDIVYVSEGRFIAALGDGGVVLLDDLGHELAFYDVPASQLVVSASGNIVLLLMQRDNLYRATRLNLNDNSLTPLKNLALQAMTRDFDGVSWSVALTDGFIHVLDTARGLKSLWKSGKLPNPVHDMRYRHCFVEGVPTTAKSEQWLIYHVDQQQKMIELESWYYSLPSRTLRSRDIIPDSLNTTNRIFLPEDYIAYSYGIEQDNEGNAQLYYLDACEYEYKTHSVSLDAYYEPENQEFKMFGFDKAFIANYNGTIYAISHKNIVIASLAWGDVRYRLAEQQNHLIVYNDRGRIFHFDMVNHTGKAISVQ